GGGRRPRRRRCRTWPDRPRQGRGRRGGCCRALGSSGGLPGELVAGTGGGGGKLGSGGRKKGGSGAGGEPQLGRREESGRHPPGKVGDEAVRLGVEIVPSEGREPGRVRAPRTGLGARRHGQLVVDQESHPPEDLTRDPLAERLAAVLEQAERRV